MHTLTRSLPLSSKCGWKIVQQGGGRGRGGLYVNVDQQRRLAEGTVKLLFFFFHFYHCFKAVAFFCLYLLWRGIKDATYTMMTPDTPPNLRSITAEIKHYDPSVYCLRLGRKAILNWLDFWHSRFFFFFFFWVTSVQISATYICIHMYIHYIYSMPVCICIFLYICKYMCLLYLCVYILPLPSLPSHLNSWWFFLCFFFQFFLFFKYFMSRLLWQSCFL